ncbi:MAG: sulfatase [Candidatus Diapherotrites archaeon]
MKYWKIAAIVLSAVLLAAWLASTAIPAEQAMEAPLPGSFRGKNLIILSFESTRADHIGFLGYYRNTTPNLDRFVENAYVFENARSQGCWTPMSFAAFFTGRFPEKIGIRGFPVPDYLKMLPEIMAENGYKTAAFTENNTFYKSYGLQQGFEKYELEGAKIGYENELMGWVRKNKGEKLFLLVQLRSAHEAYLPKKPYDTMFDPDYSGNMPKTKDEFYALWQQENAKRIQQGKEKVDASTLFWVLAEGQKLEDVNDSLLENYLMQSVKVRGEKMPSHDHLVALYDGYIREGDEFFGRFIADLKKEGLLDSSIIVIHSDHGEGFYEHNQYDHAYGMYEELLHVPLAIRFPGQEEGVRVKERVRLVDFTPTVIDLLGLEADSNVKQEMDGTNFFEALKENPDYAFPVFNYFDAFNPDYEFPDAYNYRQRMTEKILSIETADGWRLDYTLGTDEVALYNLNNDKFGQKNIAAEHPEKAGELKNQLFAHYGYLLGGGE